MCAQSTKHMLTRNDTLRALLVHNFQTVSVIFAGCSTSLHISMYSDDVLVEVAACLLGIDAYVCAWKKALSALGPFTSRIDADGHDAMLVITFSFLKAPRAALFAARSVLHFQNNIWLSRNDARRAVPMDRPGARAELSTFLHAMAAVYNLNASICTDALDWTLTVTCMVGGFSMRASGPACAGLQNAFRTAPCSQPMRVCATFCPVFDAVPTCEIADVMLHILCSAASSQRLLILAHYTLALQFDTRGTADGITVQTMDALFGYLNEF